MTSVASARPAAAAALRPPAWNGWLLGLACQDNRRCSLVTRPPQLTFSRIGMVAQPSVLTSNIALCSKKALRSHCLRWCRLPAARACFFSTCMNIVSEGVRVTCHQLFSFLCRMTVIHFTEGSSLTIWCDWVSSSTSYAEALIFSSSGQTWPALTEALGGGLAKVSNRLLGTDAKTVKKMAMSNRAIGNGR